MHELIDREDPKCLYCNGSCDLHMDGEIILTTLSYEVQSLRCRRCHETFEIHWVDDNGETKYLGFTFTCGSLTVHNLYDKGFCIGGKELLYSQWQAAAPEFNYIEKFNVDFSNKNKLYEKLKTYLIFS